MWERAKSQSKKRPMSSIIAWICQREESRIMKAKTAFTERYFKVNTNLFDGHLRELGELDLAACESYVKEVTGYTVSFATEPLTLTHQAFPISAPLSSSLSLSLLHRHLLQHKPPSQRQPHQHKPPHKPPPS